VHEKGYPYGTQKPRQKEDKGTCVQRLELSELL